jgi:hypothetical protein
MIGPGVIPPTVMRSNMELFASNILQFGRTSYSLFLFWKASLLYSIIAGTIYIVIYYVCGRSLFKRFMQCIKTCFSRFSLLFFTSSRSLQKKTGYAIFFSISVVNVMYCNTIIYKKNSLPKSSIIHICCISSFD